MHQHQKLIEHAYKQREHITAHTIGYKIKEAIQEVIQALEFGSLRVAEKINKQWVVHKWIKKAVLLYFCSRQNKVSSGNFTKFFDKIPLQYSEATQESLQHQRVRIVPPACVRKGAYIGQHTVLMPCYVNIGAYIDEGCMIDTWSTVGSCAQIGKNVHLSGGVGIGGVLEPLQANPTIIEDNCFIGARSEIVEGVIIEENSVISMGVYIGQSTRIYDRMKSKIFYGRVPSGSVVVPGSLPAKDGTHSLFCAVIVKQVDAKTRKKIEINELLHVMD